MLKNLLSTHPNQAHEVYPNVHTDVANKKNYMYVENLHEPYPNVQRPFEDVSTLKRSGFSRSESKGVSVRDWFALCQTKDAIIDHRHYGEGSLFTHNQFMSNEYAMQRILHPALEESSSHNKFGEANLTYSMLHHPEHTRLKALGNIIHYDGFIYIVSHDYVT